MSGNLYPFEVMKAVHMAQKKCYFLDSDDIGECRKTFIGHFFTKWPNSGKTRRIHVGPRPCADIG